jgi:hypothetical protein
MADKENNVSSKVAFWVSQFESYERQFGPWEKRSKEIIKRYRDERKDAAKSRARFNILWSNIQTLHPAIYSQTPKANIDRRFQDDDDLGRYASMVLERAVSYYVNNELFDKVMKQSTLDRLLPGRGVAWVRYVPVFTEEPQITDDTNDEENNEELVTEDVVPDYVHWQDFGHTWARTWQEVRGVWRRVFMGRAELVQRFGEEKGNAIPLDASIKGADGDLVADSGKKAAVYEVWDKAKKKAIWIHRDMPDVLDELDDPLQLECFFPCPEPIYATLTNDDLIPSPDYTLYQDQALELDMLTGRISSISKSLKVAGVYDGSAEGLDRLLSEGVENKLIPVEQWALLGQQGIKGAVSFFPLEEIANTLKNLIELRREIKNDIYEITGISDVIRGATNANETAAAQQLKGQFANLRLGNQQKDVARFSCDLVRIMTEIIAQHFSLETIKKLSGIKLLTAAEKQQIQMAQQQMQAISKQSEQTGQPPAPMPPIPEDALELMGMPTWEDVEQLIRDDTARSFRIDIETDSTIKTDQEAEKQSRTEFLTAVTGFMQQAVVAPPDLQPLMMEMLLFGVRAFKVSREIETTFENVLSKIKKQSENPAPQQPSAEELKAQAEQQRTQGQMQIEQLKQQGVMAQIQAQSQADQQRAGIEQQKAGIEAQKMGAELELKKMDLLIKQADIEIKRLEVAGRQQEAVMKQQEATENDEPE